MAELYDIDVLRAVITHVIDDTTFRLSSFYEQTEDEQQIERYVDTLKDLIALQNNEKIVSGYKATGIISQRGEAELLNIRSNYIAPLEYTCRFNLELLDRDYVLGKIKTALAAMRGRKYDCALMSDGSVIVFDNPEIYIGTDTLPELCDNMLFKTAYDPVNDVVHFYDDLVATCHLTVGLEYNLYVWYAPTPTAAKTLYSLTFVDATSPQNPTITLTALGAAEQFIKVSMSFNGIQSQQPITDNGLDRIWLYFNGSATIVDSGVMLGNDIIETIVVSSQVGGSAPQYIEPLELPSALAIDDDTYQTWSSSYMTMERNLGFKIALNYTLVADMSQLLPAALYAYARYGGGITDPDGTWAIKECRWAFGVLTIDEIDAKLGAVAIVNSNSDVVTLKVEFKVGAY